MTAPPTPPRADTPVRPALHGAYDRRATFGARLLGDRLLGAPTGTLPAVDGVPLAPPLGPDAAEAALAPIYARGDRWMVVLVGVHAALALALAPVYGTWRVTLLVSAAAAGAFYLARWRRPGTLLTRCVAGVSLQAFCALHIHQMSGLAEMHFFYFTSVSALVLYQDWRAMWPGIVAIIVQHTLFSAWHNAGVHPGGQRFFEPAHVGAAKLAWHYGVALAQSGIASYAAVVLRRRTLRDAAQRQALAAQAADLGGANAQLHEQAAELEAQAASLQEQAVELEFTNDQLQDQQAELEAQAHALAEQTEAAERAGRELAATLDRVRESEERFRAVQSASPDGFMLFRSVRAPDGGPDTAPNAVPNDRPGAGGPAPAGRVIDFEWIYTNPAAERLVGRAHEALVGRRLLDVMPANREEGLLDAYVGVVASGEPARRELRYAHGAVDRWFAVTAVRVGDGLGVTFADVTARKQAEAEAERARRAAEEANRAKGEFLATMSHELRTPLNAIGGYAELLAMGIRGPVSDEQAADLARIRRSQRHLSGLITDILNFAKLEAGRVELRPAAVPAAELLAGLDALVAPLVAAKGLRYAAAVDDAGGPPLAVHADADRARQVLLNLVTNAVKFTDAGGEVRVTVARAPNDGRPGVGGVRFEVRDTGRGIPPDRLEAIFEPFVQVDRHRTHESQQGVGLGLAISRDLARAMGGDVTVESRPGVGSAFTVTLPAA